MVKIALGKKIKLKGSGEYNFFNQSVDTIQTHVQDWDKIIFQNWIL